MSSLDEWRLNRAKGAILSYVAGEPRATLKWVLGVLKGSQGVTKDEALRIIHFIRQDPAIVWTEDRLRRLQELVKAVEEARW